MKKFIFIFLLGQMLLLSYIYTNSVYNIYSQNNVGDSTLKAYLIKDVTGDKLNRFFDYYTKNYILNKKINLQIIKKPVTEGNLMLYEIYHSNTKNFIHMQSVSKNTKFEYFKLSKEEFIDSTGIFYSDLSKNDIGSIEKFINIEISKYNENDIEYQRILTFSVLNFIILFVLTTIILFIYTFLRIKVNAVKKMLGYSPLRMVLDSLKYILFIQVYCFIITLTIHLAYYAFSNRLSILYFTGLMVFMLCIIFVNIVILFFTTVSIRMIDINLMIKNKICSNKWSGILHVFKIVLLIAVVISVSSFINSYKEYKNSVDNLDNYKYLKNYFTCSGFNADESKKIENDPKYIFEIREDIKNLYNFYNVNNKLLTMTSFFNNDNQPNSYKSNYVLLNKKYIEEFAKLVDENGEKLSIVPNDKFYILVPEKYKNKKHEISDFFKKRFDFIINYGPHSATKEKVSVDKLEILYIENDQNLYMLGKERLLEDKTILNSIIMVDNGKLDELFYLDEFAKSNIAITLSDRDSFTNMLNKYNLGNLLNVATLLTPYMDEINYHKFIVYQSLVFSMLFFTTLIFILYISNYLNVMIGKKAYAIKHILGFGIVKTLKVNLTATFLLLFLIIPMIIHDVNIFIFIIALLIDISILTYFYKVIIEKDVHSILKGE